MCYVEDMTKNVRIKKGRFENGNNKINIKEKDGKRNLYFRRNDEFLLLSKKNTTREVYGTSNGSVSLIHTISIRANKYTRLLTSP